jgi:hypothetical protein
VWRGVYKKRRIKIKSVEIKKYKIIKEREKGK